MKKFAKMSLAAAVAVAGFASTASAADLTEAIKGVDISGKVRYRMEELQKEAVVGTKTGNEYQDVNIDITTKVPVNDTVTFISNLNIDNDNTEGTFEYAGQTTKNINLDNYYFQYANGPVTGMVGTFDIPGRLTDALTGSGAAVLYNAGVATVGYGAMYNSEASSEMINTVIAMGTVGPVSLLGQYVDVDDVMKVYNVKADASIEMVNFGLEYSDKDLDNTASNLNDYSTFKAYVGASVGILSAKLTYAETGDQGGGSIDNAAETPAEFLLWNVGSNDATDATNTAAKGMDIWAIDASAKVTDKITLRVAYADGEINDGTAAGNDVDELLGQVSYKMSKNLNTYLRVSEFDDSSTSDEEGTRGRIEIQYSF